MNGIPETVTPAGLRERAKIMRGILDEGCARHLELAADKIERFHTALEEIAGLYQGVHGYRAVQLARDALAALSHPTAHWG